MKPRDPRRILHNNALQKGAPIVTDQHKINAPSGSAIIGNMGIPRQEDQVENKLVASSGMKPPDITMQFTSNLRNIADIVSVSQACIPSPGLAQTALSQPAQVHQAGLETKAESRNLRTSSDLTSETATSVPPRPFNANAWSDVEHLFEGFDDKQKAAIQRERARRLEEQKKMFAVRKLCLVLDLDHTLLNSAKARSFFIFFNLLKEEGRAFINFLLSIQFVEVDRLHDEMLRKKEEQDREKSQRHLFRFPHMGMWTKLRPGIWNFLEKVTILLI